MGPAGEKDASPGVCADEDVTVDVGDNITCSEGVRREIALGLGEGEIFAGLASEFGEPEGGSARAGLTDVPRL